MSTNIRTIIENNRKLEEFITSLSNALGKALFTSEDGELAYADSIVINAEQNIVSTTLSDGSTFDIVVRERKKQAQKMRSVCTKQE